MSEAPPKAVEVSPAVAVDSPIQSLAARRRKATEALFTDLPVPRYDPPVHVRYRPVDAPVLARLEKKREEEAKKRSDAGLTYACRVLAEACVGVILDVDEHNQPVGDPESWPVFGKELAEMLEVEYVGAVQTVQTLYATDGDIIAAANTVAEFSGYITEQEARERQGE